MQRILRRHFFRKFGLWFLLFAGALLYIFQLNIRFEADSLVGENILEMYSVMCCMYVVFGKSGEARLWMPEAMYLMPVSKLQRRVLVKKMLKMYWFVLGLIIACATCAPIIWEWVSTGRMSALPGLVLAIQMGIALLVAYPGLYFGSIEIVEMQNLYIVVGAICYIVEIVTCIMIDDVLAGGTAGIGWFAIAGVVLCAYIAVDIWFHKRYFDGLLEYYSDYESSRKMNKKRK